MALVKGSYGLSKGIIGQKVAGKIQEKFGKVTSKKKR